MNKEEKTRRWLGSSYYGRPKPITPIVSELKADEWVIKGIWKPIVLLGIASLIYLFIKWCILWEFTW